MAQCGNLNAPTKKKQPCAACEVNNSKINAYTDRAYMKHRENSFDLVRHFAAILVFYSHHYALSNRPEPTFPGWDTYGFVAVVIFFTISGYFMPTSFNNSKNFIEFMGKRCRRIFLGSYYVLSSSLT